MIDTAKHCRGCTNDYYNRTNSGLNMVNGRPQCWNAESATLVEARDVPTDMRPPYLSLPLVKRPSCYKAPYYSRVKASQPDARGFWR